MGDWGKFDGLEVLVSMLGSECDEYVQILKYIGPEYLLGHSFVSIFEYIRLFVQFSIQIFIRTYFIRMYSDIRSCQICYTYQYIRTFTRVKKIVFPRLMIFAT